MQQSHVIRSYDFPMFFLWFPLGPNMSLYLVKSDDSDIGQNNPHGIMEPSGFPTTTITTNKKHEIQIKCCTELSSEIIGNN